MGLRRLAGPEAQGVGRQTGDRGIRWASSRPKAGGLGAQEESMFQTKKIVFNLLYRTSIIAPNGVRCSWEDWDVGRCTQRMGPVHAADGASAYSNVFRPLG